MREDAVFHPRQQSAVVKPVSRSAQSASAKRLLLPQNFKRFAP